jgi:hypothetical protein
MVKLPKEVLIMKNRYQILIIIIFIFLLMLTSCSRKGEVPESAIINYDSSNKSGEYIFGEVYKLPDKGEFETVQLIALKSLLEAKSLLDGKSSGSVTPEIKELNHEKFDYIYKMLTDLECRESLDHDTGILIENIHDYTINFTFKDDSEKRGLNIEIGKSYLLVRAHNNYEEIYRHEIEEKDYVKILHQLDIVFNE